MKIEELFDNELYHNYGMLTTDEANCLINYLKTEVTEYVAGLQKQIAELEAQAPKVVKPQMLPVLDRKCECGAALDYGANYCNNCGAKLVWRDDEVPPYVIRRLKEAQEAKGMDGCGGAYEQLTEESP